MADTTNSAFAQGRRDAFHTIGQKLATHEHNIARYAQIFLEDCFEYGDAAQVSEERERLLFATEHILSTTTGHFQGALAQLKDGKSVHDLTGQPAIRTYHPIIDGNYEAGFYAAGEDFMVMLLGYNSAGIAAQTLQDLKENGGFKADITPILNRITAYCPNVMKDIMLFHVQEDIKDKARRYAQRVYADHYDPRAQSNVIKDFLKAVARIEHHSTRNMRRGHKIPDSWPALNDNAPKERLLAAMQLPHLTAANDDARAYDWEALPESRAPEYIRGFKDTLACIYLQVQDYHFSAKAEKNYAPQIGLSQTWEKAAGDLSPQICLALRDAILPLLHEEMIRGEGTTYEDGFTGAKDWARARVLALQPKGLDKDMHGAHIARKLKEFCLEMVDETYLEPLGPAPAPDNDSGDRPALNVS